MFVKTNKVKTLQIPLDKCSKIEAPAIKVSTKDFDRIVNGCLIYTHDINTTWKLVLDKQPKIIKIYADNRTAIICRLFGCAKFVRNVIKNQSSMGTLTERQFYVKAYIRTYIV